MKMNVIATVAATVAATADAMVVRRKRLPPPMPLRKDRNTRGHVIMI